MPRQITAEQQKARRIIAARLLVVCAFVVCVGVLLFQGTEYLLSLRRESALLSPSTENETRVPADASVETRININTATAADLQSVPGFGPELASRILTLRKARGGFHFLEELKDVNGIGDKRFEVLKEIFFCPPPDVQLLEENNPASF